MPIKQEFTTVGVSDYSEKGSLEAPPSSSEVWRNLDSWLRPIDKHYAFWWRITGQALSVMLREAGYDLHAQYQGLLFHLRYIVPYLGPRPIVCGMPSKWRSFMTDDFSPLEYSWSWHAEGTPRVRYAIEAIGLLSGTSADPYNQVTTRDLVQELQLTFPTIDWKWFDYFMEALCGSFPKVKRAGQQPQSPNYRSRNWQRLNFGLWRSKFWQKVIPDTADWSRVQSDHSSVGLAFELQEGVVAAKAYFSPIKALQTKQSPFEVVFASIRSLEAKSFTFPALRSLFHFMTMHPEGSLLQTIGVAVDCINPADSRLKIYVRSPRTSFDSVRAVMTLGNKPLSSQLPDHLEETHHLWRLVLGLEEDFASNKELPPTEHQTAGVLYNIDIRPGNAALETKLYIPVKHYGANDFEIAQGLITYLRKQGKDHYAANYMRMLEGICTHRSLSDGLGLQSYIACAEKNGLLSITSYLSPEIYHKTRRVDD